MVWFVTTRRGSGQQRLSRCTTPSASPYVWEDFQDGVERVVENELEDLMQEGCATEYEFTRRMGRIHAVRERAAAGELDPPDELKPIRDRPEVWEIRWYFDERPFRLYHAEPNPHPSILLGLRYHWKQTEDSNGNGLSSAEIDRLQDVHIDIASDRFTRWTDSP